MCLAGWVSYTLNESVSLEADGTEWKGQRYCAAVTKGYVRGTFSQPGCGYLSEQLQLTTNEPAEPSAVNKSQGALSIRPGLPAHHRRD